MSGSVWLIVGSVVFLVGAAIGVPKVFMTADRDERLRLLEDHLGWWRAAQFGYGVGPSIASAGAIVVGAGIGGAAGVLWMAAGASLMVGSLAWAWSCWLRGLDPLGWARGEQSGRPFRAYVWLTLGGLAALGAGVFAADLPGWLGWLVVVADAGYLTLFVVTGDIPPFVFYVLLLVVGVVAG